MHVKCLLKRVFDTIFFLIDLLQNENFVVCERQFFASIRDVAATVTRMDLQLKKRISKMDGIVFCLNQIPFQRCAILHDKLCLCKVFPHHSYGHLQRHSGECNLHVLVPIRIFVRTIPTQLKKKLFICL